MQRCSIFFLQLIVQCVLLPLCWSSSFDSTCSQTFANIETPTFRNNTHVSVGSHLLASNHKTGTVLANCFVKHVRSVTAINVKQDKHCTGSFNYKAYQVNFIRNPFDMMASAYAYDKRCSEKWAHDLITTHKRGVWNRWCQVNNNQSFIIDVKNDTACSVLNRLPLREGLIYTMLRNFLFSVSNMVSSALDCYRVDRAAAYSGEPTGCKNVFLKSFIENFTVYTNEFLVPALNFSEITLGKLKFAELQKRLSLCSPEHAQSAHVTSVGHELEREDMVRRIRLYDRQFFDEKFARYEALLNKLIHKQDRTTRITQLQS